MSNGEAPLGDLTTLTPYPSHKHKHQLLLNNKREFWTITIQGTDIGRDQREGEFWAIRMIAKEISKINPSHGYWKKLATKRVLNTPFFCVKTGCGGRKILFYGWGTRSIDQKKNDYVRSGIRTHASIRRPERPLPLRNGKEWQPWVWRLRPLGHPDTHTMSLKVISASPLLS